MSFYYYKSIRHTTVQFINMFNDIKIAKYDSDGNIEKYVPVPIKLGTKEKFWHWIHERKYERRLPAMAINLVACTYDADRNIDWTQVMSQITSSITQEEVEQFLTPTPYNLSYQLVISSLNMSEMDQILEQILPFFSPDSTFTIRLNDIDTSYNVKVVLDSATPEYDMEITEESYRLLNWTLDFTAKTYIFKPIKDTKIIHKVLVNMYTNTLTTSTSGISGTGYVGTLQTSGYKDLDNNIITKYELFDEPPEE